MLKHMREEEMKKNAQREVDMVATHIINNVLANSKIGIRSCSFSYSPHSSYSKYEQHLRVLVILENQFPDINIMMKTVEHHGQFKYFYSLDW